MENLLDVKLCTSLRKVINEINIFAKDENESKKFNLICAVMDRFDSVVKYINENSNMPKTENDFIEFMMFSCTIKDGVNYILKVLNFPIKKDNGIFKRVYQRRPLNVPKDKVVTDDDFFDYFRSLVFAHPFFTDRAIPVPAEKGEIQYSPFVLVDVHGLEKENNSIGVMVYSNKREDFSIKFSFDILKEYIKWKYEMIGNITKGFKDIIQIKEEAWKKHKVNRTMEPIETLNNVKDILEERCLESDIIKDLILDLNCISTKLENEESVSLYKKAIISIIPEICDAVDEYNHEKIYEIIRNVNGVRPDGHKIQNQN